MKAALFKAILVLWMSLWCAQCLADVSMSQPALKNAKESGVGSFREHLISHISVKQMGYPQGISLRGGQFQTGLNFTLPNNQLVTHARFFLHLQLPATLADRQLSLQLTLNGQPLGTVPLRPIHAFQANYQLDIPAVLIASGNNLSFNIKNGKALLCQRKLQKPYQITILPTTYIELDSQLLPIAADLNQFPKPFVDTQQMTPMSVGMAFPTKMTPGQVSAAALIASWLGIQAGYRGVSFHAFINQLPEKNGILIGMPGEKIGGITLPKQPGPLLRIIDNPNDPAYKLLIITGSNTHQLRMAAWRLTQGQFKPNTLIFHVKAQQIPYRKPYDAPRWITTKRPVYLSELVHHGQDMAVKGVWHDVLRVSFRAAPDLFLWDEETFPLHLSYRFPSQNWIDEKKSYLNVVFNHQFLRNLPVNKPGVLELLWDKLGGDRRQEHVDLPIEPYMIYGDNQLSLYFKITPKKNVPCQVLLDKNITSRMKHDSWIDLSHSKHFARLPNLSYFVGASFPFSKMADYSQTVLLLPSHPDMTQISTLFDLAARSGNQTGIALNHNQVLFGFPTKSIDQDYLNSRNILAVSTLSQQAFNDQLLAHSPFTASRHLLGVRTQSIWQTMRRWVEGEWNLNAQVADRYFSSVTSWRGFVSFRSQWNKRRVVVLAIGSSDKQLSHLHNDLREMRINAAIRGDAAIITNENGVRSFDVAPSFPSGQLPWYMVAIWFASAHSIMLALLMLATCSLVGLVLFRLMKRRARKRLHLK